MALLDLDDENRLAAFDGIESAIQHGALVALHVDLEHRHVLEFELVEPAYLDRGWPCSQTPDWRPW